MTPDPTSQNSNTPSYQKILQIGGRPARNPTQQTFEAEINLIANTVYLREDLLRTLPARSKINAISALSYLEVYPSHLVLIHGWNDANATREITGFRALLEKHGVIPQTNPQLQDVQFGVPLTGPIVRFEGPWPSR